MYIISEYATHTYIFIVLSTNVLTTHTHVCGSKKISATHGIHLAPLQLWLPFQVLLDQTPSISFLLQVWQQIFYHFHHLPELQLPVAAKMTHRQSA